LEKIDPKKTIFLVDGSGFLYRAYYGMRPLHTSTGVAVQAVYSFCRMLKKLLVKFDIQNIALVWDSPGKTERHAIFNDYKATRQSPPSDLFEQKDKICEFAKLISLKQVAQVGIEADDLIYSLAHDFSQAGYQVVLVTSDKDMFQLLNGQIVVFDAFKDEFVTCESYENKLGFSVSQIPFYFALLGDSSDNIPGVRGIGQKGASELVQQFANLDDLYANLDKVKKIKTKDSLLQNKDLAYLSLDLFSLRYHHLDLKIADLEFNLKNWPKARELFVSCEFKSLVSEIDSAQSKQLSLNSASSVLDLNSHAEFFADLKNYKFLPITSEQELVVLCENLRQKLFAIDTETTGLNFYADQLVGISVCYQPGLAYYIPLAHANIPNQLSIDLVWHYLKPVLENPSYPKCLHNAKFDQHVLYTAGVKLAGIVFDTMLAANLVVEQWQRVGLKQLSERYLGDKMLSFGELVKTTKIKNFSEVGLELAVKYAAADAHQTLLLYQIFKDQITQVGASELYYQIELPVSQLLFEIELVGIYLNKAKLANLGQEVVAQIKAIEQQIDSKIKLETGFNLNSPRQVEDLLFNMLGLPTQKKSDKRTGYSTDQEVLETLSDLHPVPKLISKYRELSKLKTTYIDALPVSVSLHDHKIHTSFSQIATATGRLASAEPNLQNIPVTGIGANVRGAFEAQAGYVFLSIDYSQIELRVLAYLSQDQSLLTAFAQGQDIHLKTASLLFDVVPDLVTHDMRQVGKRINFSILYGLTPYGLAKDLKISLNEAKTYINKFFAQYPGVHIWMEQVIAGVCQNGYVTTYWGRRRYIPEIYEKNKNLYDAAKRIAVNTVAQGTAAELVKKGMLALHGYLKNHDAQILLQIHDELLISVAENQIVMVAENSKKILENIVGWNVPLVVTTRTGYDWQKVTK
jgi:DNA polymerase-1